MVEICIKKKIVAFITHPTLFFFTEDLFDTKNKNKLFLCKYFPRKFLIKEGKCNKKSNKKEEIFSVLLKIELFEVGRGEFKDENEAIFISIWNLTPLENLKQCIIASKHRRRWLKKQPGRQKGGNYNQSPKKKTLKKKNVKSWGKQT